MKKVELFIGSVPTQEEFDRTFIYGDTDDRKRLYNQLVTEYSNIDRYYHSLHHIGQVLGMVDFLLSNTHFPMTNGETRAIRLAAWFHDVVYDPKRNDNEEQSALWMAKATANLNLPTSFLTAITEMILATRNHATTPDALLTHLLLDADLSILGAPPEIYARYASSIRQEYAFVPENTYRTSRRAILEQFLARPRIFFTPPAIDLFEHTARVNLQGEILRMS